MKQARLFFDPEFKIGKRFERTDSVIISEGQMNDTNVGEQPLG